MSALAKILFFSFHSLSEIIDKKVLVLFFFVPKAPKEHFVIQKLNSKKKKKKKKKTGIVFVSSQLASRVQNFKVILHCALDLQLAK